MVTAPELYYRAVSMFNCVSSLSIIDGQSENRTAANALLTFKLKILMNNTSSQNSLILLSY